MLWPARLLIYSLAAWLGLWVIFPAAGEGVWGMLLAAPTAAVAIALDIFLSAKVLGYSGEREAVRRVVALDRVLGGQLERREIESREIPEIEAEAEEDPLQLPEGSSRSKTSPPSDR